MTAEVAAAPLPKTRERTLSNRIVRALNKSPIHIGSHWSPWSGCAPTVGLLVTSFRDRR